jgi:sulfopyruvate decarboxylase TPP-binding subunit
VYFIFDKMDELFNELKTYYEKYDIEVSVPFGVGLNQIQYFESVITVSSRMELPDEIKERIEKILNESKPHGIVLRFEYKERTTLEWFD